MSFAIIRGGNGRRHEVDFGDDPVRLDVSIGVTTVQITVENGRLVGEMDGRGKQELIAASDTEFSGLYGLGVQFIDGGLFVKHVSGNYRFARR